MSETLICCEKINVLLWNGMFKNGAAESSSHSLRKMIFFSSISILIRNLFVYLHRPNLSLWADGDNYIAEKATLYALFLAAWTSEIQTLIKDKCRGDAYGCVYTQPGCAEGTCTLTHTFGVLVYTPTWVSFSVRSIREASDGLSSRMGSRRYPRFFLYVVEAWNY